jgi:hypothetical protein
MKAVPLALLLSLPLALNAAEVQRGETLDEVRNVLGAPQGQLRIGNRQLLYYDRGEVELQSGAVTRVALLSVEEHAEQTARRAAAAARIREEQEIRQARQIADGDALKTRKLADPSFLATPLAYQVAFWEDFSRRYPDVPIAEQLTVARLRLAEQVEEKRAQTAQAERLAELEIRVHEAEARAAEAESTARRIRYYSSYYGPSYSRHPFNLMPVDYRFNDAPVPVIRSPGNIPGMMPVNTPRQVPGRFDGHHTCELPKVDDNCDDDGNDSRKNGRYSNSDPRRFTGRNRM